MAFTEPANYQPREDLEQLLVNSGPAPGSALFDMVMYRQWTRYWWKNKTSEKAWEDLHMSPANARVAIDTRIAPLSIYPQVLERAKSDLA